MAARATRDARRGAPKSPPALGPSAQGRGAIDLHEYQMAGLYEDFASENSGAAPSGRASETGGRPGGRAKPAADQSRARGPPPTAKAARNLTVARDSGRAPSTEELAWAPVGPYTAGPDPRTPFIIPPAYYPTSSQQRPQAESFGGYPGYGPSPGYGPAEGYGPPPGYGPAEGYGLSAGFGGPDAAAGRTPSGAPDTRAGGAAGYLMGELSGTRAERGLGIDMHEVLKQKMFESPGAACDDHFEKNRPCADGVHGASDQYMTLDSFYKVRSSRPDQGVFAWNFMVQGVTGDEVVGVRDTLDTITEVQLGSFSMPIPPDVPYVLAAAPPASPSGLNQLVLVHNNNNGATGAPTLVPNVAGSYGQYPWATLTPPATTLTPWVNNPYTQLACGNQLTVQMLEAGLQSFSDPQGARHHFKFEVKYLGTPLPGLNPTMLQAEPAGKNCCWDTFIFTDPLQDVHGLTLVFRNPDIPVRFEPDCLYDVSVVSDGAVAPGPYLRVVAPAHGLNVGDRVFVLGFKSGVAVLDNFVGRREGIVVSGNPTAAALAPGTPLSQAPAPGPYPDTFWFDPSPGLVDFAPAPTLPQTVTVCVAKRRLRIPVRFRRVVSRLTNYKAP